MTLIAQYLLKMMVCSAIMFAYYLLVLRNKKFHQYNRFYLLSIIVLSWLIPLIKINVTAPVVEQPDNFNQLMYVIADSNSSFEENTVIQQAAFNWNNVLLTAYISVCVLFLLVLLRGLFKIYYLLKTNPCKSLGEVYLILTAAEGSPFSFFKYIFWNTEIEINSDSGKQILQHELIHVKDKHSIDKLMMQVVLIIAWINPIFWLVKKELNMIHEFIADNKSIKNGDASLLARMLLAATYPQQKFLLTNPFFFSPIKRRLFMLTNNKNPRLSYGRRVIVLPLIAVVVLLFAFRKKENHSYNHNNGKLNKTYTVVIDAGHGGSDLGATAVDGTHEKDYALQLAKAVKTMNENADINIILTREDDVFKNVKEKADFINKHKADLMVSIHCNEAGAVLHTNGTKTESSANGMELYIASKTNEYFSESQRLAYEINNSLSGSFNSSGVKQREKKIYILSDANCPSTLVECGFLSNKKDVEILKNVDKQKQMAALILEGINKYIATKESDNITYTTVADNFNNNKDSISTEQYNEIEAKLNSLKHIKKLPNGKHIIYFDYDKNSKEIYKGLYPTYSLMSQAQKVRLGFVMVKNAPAKKELPTEAQINSWKNPDLYGLWIDDKHVTNSELNKYHAKDFSKYYASKLYGGAKEGKKYSVQIDLYTNKYFDEKMCKDTTINIGVAIPYNKTIKDTITQISMNGNINNDEIKLAENVKNEKDKIAISPDTLVSIRNSERNKMLSFQPKGNGKDPLYVIDGVVIEQNPLQYLNPNNIYAINVFKDQSVIDKYGDKAKNGVVEITTKSFLNNQKKILQQEIDSLKKQLDETTKQHRDVSVADVQLARINKDKVLVILNGAKLKQPFSFHRLIIDRSVILDSVSAVTKYGKDGKYGAVELYTLQDINDVVKVGTK